MVEKGFESMVEHLGTWCGLGKAPNMGLAGRPHLQHIGDRGAFGMRRFESRSEILTSPKSDPKASHTSKTQPPKPYHVVFWPEMAKFLSFATSRAARNWWHILNEYSILLQ